jgi:hypothetical protein
MGDAMSEPSTRWELIRDLLAFQLKLAADALRDFVISPIALVAGVIDLVRGGARTGELFQAVLAAGRRSERIINLFGEESLAEGEKSSIDALVGRFEKLVVEQYEKGGVTASAKAAIDRSLDAIEQLHRKPPGPPAV